MTLLPDTCTSEDTVQHSTAFSNTKCLKAFIFKMYTCTCNIFISKYTIFVSSLNTCVKFEYSCQV